MLWLRGFDDRLGMVLLQYPFRPHQSRRHRGGDAFAAFAMARVDSLLLSVGHDKVSCP